MVYNRQRNADSIKVRTEYTATMREASIHHNADFGRQPKPQRSLTRKQCREVT